MSLVDSFLRYPAVLDDMESSQYGLSVSSDSCRWGSDSHNGISSISVTCMDWECLSLPSLSIVENRWLSLDGLWCSVGWGIDGLSVCGLVLGLMIGCQGEFLCQSYGYQFVFGNMKQGINGNGILLNWLLRSIYKKWDLGREKFSGNLTWNRFPLALSIWNPSQKSGV